MKHFLPIFMTAGVLMTATSVYAQTSDSLGQGIDGTINALVSDPAKNLLYAGGSFVKAGGNTVNNIARWDGLTWSSLDKGIPYGGVVYCMTMFNGELYAGGQFTAIDTLVVNNIARWDGSKWHPVGSGIASKVYAMIVYNGELFASIGSAISDSSSVYKWTGTDWIMVGAKTGKIASALNFTIHNGSLYFSGYCGPNTGGYYNAARWTGTEWMELDTGFNGNVTTLVSHGGNLFVGGSMLTSGYLSASNTWVNNIAMRSGNRWTSLTTCPFNDEVTGSGLNDAVLSFLSYKGLLFIGGVFTHMNYSPGICQTPASGIAVWSGRWGNGGITLTPSSGAKVTAMTEHNGKLVLAGSFTAVNGVPANNISIYNISTISHLALYHAPLYRTGELNQPYLLQEAYSFESGYVPVNICADSSRSTVVKFYKTGSTPVNCVIRMKADTAGNDPVKYGRFNFNDLIISGDTLIARYQHPYYYQGTGLYKNELIEIVDQSNNSVVFSYPVRIYRAPIVMLHGLWSDRSAFKLMELDLHAFNNYIPELTYRGDYKPSHAQSFNYNNFVIPSSIDAVLMQARQAGFSAGKADLIVHSMGGILSRLYLQGPNYCHDVNRLITLNTPHAGAQGANLLMNPALGELRFAMDYTGHSVYDGAVDDLRVNSPAVLLNLNGNNLNKRIVPSSALVTFSPVYNSTGWEKLMIDMAAIRLSNKTSDEFVLTLFNNESSDLVVPVSSQQGGLEVYTLYNPLWHSSTGNPGIMSLVQNLLSQSPFDTVFYSSNGYQPPKLTSVYKKEPVLGKSHVITQTGKVTITSPGNGSYFYPGDSVAVSITTDSSIIRIICAFSVPDGALQSQDTAVTGNITLNFQIPFTSIGPIKLIALGYDSAGYTDFDTVSIESYTFAGTDSLDVYPKKIFLPVGRNTSIEVNAYFSDSTVRDVSYVSGLTNQVNDPATASFVSPNRIEGKKPGLTMATFSYGGKSAKVLVYVLDTLTVQIPTKVTNTVSQNYMNTLFCYPNPADDRVTIITSYIQNNSESQLFVYDAFGRKIKQLLVTGSKMEIDCRDLPSGVYFVSVTRGDVQMTGKLIVK